MYFFPVRIYYEDTDSGGVVYYANYLKYMERARTEWLRSKGIEQDKLNIEKGIIFAVKSVQINYLGPGLFNDLLYVSVRLKSANRVIIDFEQNIYRLSETSDSQPWINEDCLETAELLSSASIQIVSICAERKKPKRMDESMKAGIFK